MTDNWNLADFLAEEADWQQENSEYCKSLVQRMGPKERQEILKANRMISSEVVAELLGSTKPAPESATSESRRRDPTP